MHKHSIHFFILITLIFSFSCLAQNQSSDSLLLKGGTWALQFGIDHYFTLTSFQGSTIGAKYQLSEKNAIRGGVTINGNNNNVSNSISGVIGGTDAGTVPVSSSGKSAGINFVVQYLWYFNPAGPVHLYTGFGPLVSYNYSNSSSDNYRLYSSDTMAYWIRQQYASKTSQWGIGGAAVLGVEWFACKWLSIHADYNESVQYQWLSNSNSQDQSSTANPNYIEQKLESSGSTKNWSLNSIGVSFGLSIYL